MNDKLAALDQENWFAAEDKSSMLQADTLAVDPTISRRQPDRLLNGVVIGTLAQIDENGHPLVDFAGNSTGQPLPARSTASLCPNDIGREVAMMFESGDPRRPVVLGAIAPPPTGAGPGR